MVQTEQLHEQSKSKDLLSPHLDGLLPQEVLDIQPSKPLPKNISWVSALRILMFYVLSGHSSRTTVAMARAAGLCELSHTSLLSMLESLEDDLHCALLHLTRAARLMAMDKAVRAHGFALMALDATRVPSAHPDNSRSHGLHVLWEMTTQMVCQLRLPHSPFSGETLSWVELTGQECVLADRVYCVRSAFEQARETESMLCARYKVGGCTLFHDQALTRGFDPVAFVNAQSPGGEHHLECWMRTSGEALPVTVSVVHMGEQWGEKQRERAQKNKQKVSSQSSALMEYLVVVAYVPRRARGLRKQLSRLYRARWGIEIEFRKMKSGRGLDELEFKAGRKLRAGICAHLIGQLLVGMASCESLEPGREVGRIAHEYEVRQAGLESLLQTLIPLPFLSFREQVSRMRDHLSCSERRLSEPRTLEWLQRHGIFEPPPPLAA